MRARALILLVAAGTAWAGPLGWLHDGSGVVDARPPAALSAPAWSVPTPAWGNATPVVLGDLVCVTEEPLTLRCLDRSSGVERWRTEHGVLTALEASEAARARPLIAAADAAEARLDEVRRTFSRLQREVRRGDDPAVAAQLAAASAELDRLKIALDAARPWRTPPDKEIIGYASATPVTDGESLYTSWGNGVVARVGRDGRVVWSRWLGAPPTPMRGYDFGQTASPRLIRGVLVVGNGGHLHGLDPSTGRVLWKGPPYADYGTPGVLDVEGLGVVLTPDGTLVGAADGAVWQTGLANVYYTGPTVSGTRAWLVGGTRPDHLTQGQPSTATALALSRVGARVSARVLWQTTLDDDQRPYTQPVVHGGRLYVLTRPGRLHVLDADDGRALSKQSLEDAMPFETFPSPMVAGGRLWVVSNAGRVVQLSLADTPQVLADHTVEPSRATPTFVGGELYLRTLTRVIRYGG